MSGRPVRRLLIALAALAIPFLVWVAGASLGRFGEPLSDRQVRETRLSDGAVAARRRQHAGPPENGAKQILFGDLHAHTSFSSDAFLWSLPLMQGDGAHPPADACDFARFCSGLDFWSINDHAESLTPARWKQTLDAVTACNQVAGEPGNPDLVSFFGWEWTQVGATPAEHWGHKNVIVRGADPALAPARPIAAGGENLAAMRRGGLGLGVPLMALADLPNRSNAYDFDRFLRDTAAVPLCPSAPAADHECIAVAETPADLFRGLDAWGGDALVIPHGTSWGATTPPGSSWASQASSAQHDPDRQRLIEVYSGHGGSEEYRAWGHVTQDGDCPEASATYLPICRRAGELVRARCLAEGADEVACEGRAAEARMRAVAAGRNAVLTLPGTAASEWGDAERCTDCFLPAFAYRPGKSAQAALALRRPDAPPFRFGLIASSDNHSARPGTGYKEVGRLGMTDERGIASPRLARLAASLAPTPASRSQAVDPEAPGAGVANAERQAGFWSTGGLVAVHAEGRGREAIWTSLERREVYGTSGPRILLWFDLENGPDGRSHPMGAEVSLRTAPRFRVRAVGSAEPLPGCPGASIDALGPEEIERLCLGECHHPSDSRRAIARIDVVRIRPGDPDLDSLEERIEDPWRSFACAERPEGCEIEFQDDEFPAASTESAYYVRAIEVASPTIHGSGRRCTEPADDCLDPAPHRAWSSPIWVTPSRIAAPASSPER